MLASSDADSFRPCKHTDTPNRDKVILYGMRPITSPAAISADATRAFPPAPSSSILICRTRADTSLSQCHARHSVHEHVRGSTSIPCQSHHHWPATMRGKRCARQPCRESGTGQVGRGARHFVLVRHAGAHRRASAPVGAFERLSSVANMGKAACNEAGAACSGRVRVSLACERGRAREGGCDGAWAHARTRQRST